MGKEIKKILVSQQYVLSIPLELKRFPWKKEGKEGETYHALALFHAKTEWRLKPESKDLEWLQKAGVLVKIVNLNGNGKTWQHTAWDDALISSRSPKAVVNISPDIFQALAWVIAQIILTCISINAGKNLGDKIEKVRKTLTVYRPSE